MANQLNIPLDGNWVNIVRQHGAAIKYVLQSKFECSADVMRMDSVMGQDFGPSRKPPMSPERGFSIRLQSIEVNVWKADLTSFQVEAIVNAANERLDHMGGLAYALSSAGGPDIQKESNAYIKSHGPLKTGEAVVSSPGRLKCKKIIHAVGPCLSFNPPWHEVDRAEPLLKTAVKNILARAEEYKLSSVAIPALSAGLFNFPVDKCANIIVETLKQYDVYRGNHARRLVYPRVIHLVNNDDPTVKEMERACRQILGGTTAPVSHGADIPKGRAETQTLLTVQIGNIHLTLSKGLIEKQQTEVIVNTSGVHLDLAQGAVSDAILKEAGRKMQEEINKNYKSFYKKLPLVLETTSHSLRCQRVFHTICDINGVDRAKEVLGKAIQKCLLMAEHQGYRSIAFPAIGTGNLGITKEEVANIMTTTVKTTAQRLTTKMDVHFVIYPHDNDTFMAFEAKIRALQRESSPDSVTGGFDDQKTSVASQLGLSSDCAEANEEAQRWLEDLFRCSGSASVSNNFIQYLGVEELRELNRDADPSSSVEESFESGSARIQVCAQSPEQVFVRVLKVEAMLCDVQKEFVREVKALRAGPSARESLSYAKPSARESLSYAKSGALSDRERQSNRYGLTIKKILPVRNTALTEAFEVKQKQLCSSAPVQRMYQRIPAQCCSLLKDIGFQREFAPPDDPKYGDGIYFAGSLASASELWRHQNRDVYQYYVEALVLTGNSTAGKRELIMPPPVGKDPLVRYDSLTGGTDIAVIFSGHQALPENILICEDRRF